MLVVVVEPAGAGISPFPLAGVAAGVGPSVGHRSVEGLHLAVGLRPVRARPLRGDRQGLTGVAPQVRPVGAAVVRQHTLDGVEAVGEPFDGAVKDADRGECGLLIVVSTSPEI